MTTYPFLQVDAFTEVPLSGNPCAVVLEAEGLTDEDMLAIAREMNLSETAFVMLSDIADFRARYFTPAEEIPLAGHPTIAVAHALIDTGRLKVTGARTAFSLELQAGVIQVEILREGAGAALIVMAQLKPQFMSTFDPAEVAPVFNLAHEDILPGAVVQTVSTGTPQLMLPLLGLESLRRARLDIPAYEALRRRADFFSPHLFCLRGATPAGNTFARHFGTPPDLLEDPFTGSATGGMAAYLWHYGLIDNPRFTTEQGHWLQRPGQASVEVIGPPDDIQTVKVGGRAVTVLRGELNI